MDSTEFFKPIISPFELELACTQSKQWTGDYETDFARILPGISANLAAPPTSDAGDSDELSFSLITGSYRTKADSMLHVWLFPVFYESATIMTLFADSDGDGETALASRSTETAIQSLTTGML
jgi:hypothetical protein